jgi:glutaminyl-peptide cyclotransferase
MRQSRRDAVRRLASLAASGWFMSEGDDILAGDKFASDRPEPVEPVLFDGLRAMQYLEEVCDIGPRISGSEGMKKQQEHLEKHFAPMRPLIEYQRFPAKQRSQKQPVEMANMLVQWWPARARRVLLAAHYDTRPIADRESNPRKWREPFVSANDGGSGIALLMELAHHVPQLKTKLGIDFVFFDGEEYIQEQGDEYFFGSKHFANQYRKAKKPPTYIAGFVLDMIGGKNAKFPIEQHSWFHAAALVMDFWNTAEELKCSAFQKREGPGVLDDHIALNRAGIPTVDIIDFSYPHWHRLSDVPANCSGDSLAQVARVLSVWLQKTE